MVDHQLEPKGASIGNNYGTSGRALSSSTIVTVCVGGTDYVTTLSTLKAAPDSYLAALFGDNWAPSLFVPGTNIPFIDRDPSRYVLAYLRFLRHEDSQLILPESNIELKELAVEAEFYGLPGLARACTLGRRASCLLRNYQRPEQQQQQHQQYPAMLRESTSAALQQSTCSGCSNSQAWSYSRPDCTDERSSTDTAGAANISSNNNDSASLALVTGEDVQLTMLHQQPATLQPLPQCILAAQEVFVSQKQSCMKQSQLQVLSELVLQHLLHLPLAAQQPDLVLALAQPEPGTQLLSQLHYYPVGALRIELECQILPADCAASTGHVSAVAAAAASDLFSPKLSPRDGSCSRPASAACVVPTRTTSGSFLPNLAATVSRSCSPLLQLQEDSSIATTAAGTEAMPGPGWGGPVTYYKYSIRETADKFILITRMPGEAQSVQEAPRTAYRPELHKYSTLHKLLVQQCPRSSVAGLMWLLESAGFSSVKLSTVLETYFVESNSFPGYKSVLACEL